MAKRRFISQLPAIHQTQTLQKFWSATVDQVFQPGQTQSINALIGRKPSYYDPKKDFYKSEVNAERAYYQLEPAMTAQSTGNTTFSDLFFYQDLVNNLRFQGAIVDDHQRLFEEDYYSWCPPVNIHKLSHYREYYWLPDGPPILVLSGTKVAYSTDGSTATFALPSASDEALARLMVTVDNEVLQGGYSVTASNLVFETAPPAGKLLTILACDTTKSYAIETTIDQLTQQTNVTTHEERDLGSIPSWAHEMRVEIRENSGKLSYQIRKDSTGKFFLETPKTETPNTFDPLYVVIEKTSFMRSQWSSNNHWYHKSVMIYNGENYKPVRSERPIIEFNGDVKLSNYGFNRIPDISVWYHGNLIPTSLNGWNISSQGPALFDGQPVFEKTAVLVEPSEKYYGITYVSGPNSNQIPDSVHAYDSESLAFDAFGNYVGEGHPGAVETMWDNDGGLEGDLVIAVQETTVQEYDLFTFLGDGKEYWYDGTVWKSGQEFSSEGPLFDVFDKDGVNLATYPGLENYKGSRIFGFKKLTNGTNDSKLGFPVSRNKFGNIEFQDFLSSEQLTSDAGPYTEFKYFAKSKKVGNSLVTSFGSNWIPAGTSTQSQNADGFFQIPLNLQANPLNDDVTTISANNWNDHFKPVLAGNDWTQPSETFDLSLGRKIIQNRSPLLRTMMMSSNASLDFMKTAMYVEREYTRYRNKFAQALKTYAQTTGIFSESQAKTTTLNAILTQLKIAKTVDFPFANNGVAGGEWFIPASAAYLGMSPLWAPEFVVERGTKGATLMVRGHDGSLIPGFTRSDDVDAVLARDGSNVLYLGTQQVDYRDFTMLALEEQIYDSVMADLKPRRRPIFDIKKFTAGKFRKTKDDGGIADYSREETLQVARPMFERWVSQNRFKYRENKIFNDANPFTWNLRSLKDRDGESIPGYWRGLYQWYFDTDRPHTHPWEMMGWTQKPTWWDAHYSWTDPQKRTELIYAIEIGLVDPVAHEYDETYQRLGFRDVVPVGLSGELLDPFQAGIVVDAGINDYAAEWDFGDMAPIEHAWWTSHVTSFTYAEMSYLLKPARFVEGNWLTADKILVHGDQWISKSSGVRNFDQSSLVHNEKQNDKYVRVLGIQTWISDYIRSLGQDVTTVLGNRVRTLGVNLAHKLGGFIDVASLKTFTENSGLIPQEDVLTALYRSPSIREEFYGGVIVEWTGRTWRVYGYDTVDPVFKIMPIKPTGNRVKITIGDETVNSVDWLPNTYYQAGVLVFYKNTNYRAIKTHTSGSKFEQEFWKAESTGKQTPAGSVTWFSDHEDEIVRIPYNTEFDSRQDVADFLNGYQAWLESRGWKFDEYDSDFNAVRDWRWSTLEFLQWSQVNWEKGTFIALSPASQNVKFTCSFGTVQNVEQMVNGTYSMLDKMGYSIPSSTVTVNRMDDEITVGVTEGGIFGMRLFVSEVEQAIVFKNTTIFSDVIYDPLFNIRQNRIRLITLLSTDWVGRFDAPGFVITDNRLVPSFDKQVEDIRYMFGIEEALSLPLRDNARHQIGYQSRSYLENLMYNEVNQFEFYQGMIQQKGAPGVFGKLLRNDELTSTQNLSFLEEWAFRTGLYGATDKDETFEFMLGSSDIKNEPQLIEFTNSLWNEFTFNASLWNPDLTQDLNVLDQQDDSVVSIYREGNSSYDKRWIVPPKGDAFTVISDYTKHKGWLSTPGYVRLDEVDYAAPTFDAFNTLIKSKKNDLVIGERIWVYDDGNQSWNVFRAVKNGSNDQDSTPNTVQSFATNDNSLGGTKITLEFDHDIQANDLIYLSKDVNIDSEISGVYRVLAADANYFVISAEVLADKDYLDPEFAPRVMKLESVRTSKKSTETVSYLTSFKCVRASSSNLTGWNQGTNSTPEFFSGSGILPSIDGYGSFEQNDMVLLKDQINSSQNGVYQFTKVPSSSDLSWKLEKVSKFAIVSIYGGNNQGGWFGDTDPQNENGVKFAKTDFANGDLLYVDVCYEVSVQNLLSPNVARWVVYQWNGTSFVSYRKQPPLVRRDLIRDIKIFDTASSRSDRTLNAKPLLYSDMVVFDPVHGMIPGVADTEIWYKLENDPAYYNAGNGVTNIGSQWGDMEVGRLWWDVSTAKFLLSETNSELDDAERRYRQINWGKLAPGASVDVYEWVKSSISPSDWQKQYESDSNPNVYDGPVMNPENPSWVETMEWDEKLQKEITVYYFWVKNRKFVPAHRDFRNVSAFEVANIISNPLGSGISFVAPISSNMLMVAGVSQFLTETSSLQFTVARNDSQTLKHAEWKIMRKGDDASLPDVSLWNKVTTSLAARDVWGTAIPDPRRFQTDKVGFDVERGQNLFSSVEGARKHVTQWLNRLFASSRFADERRSPEILNMLEDSEDGMKWMQKSGSYYIQPIPTSLFKNRYPMTTQGSSDFSSDTDDKLLYSLIQGEAYWSVNSSNHVGRYDYKSTIDQLDGQGADGDRALVEGTASTGGFWTLWTKMSGEWKLTQIQRFNTADTWSIVDWYAEGYSATDEPSIVFASTQERDLATINSTVKLVKVINDGTGRWMWNTKVDGIWEIVAKEKATIQISDRVWSTTGNVLDLSGLTVSEFQTHDVKSLVENRDRGYEINALLHILREEILTNLEINSFFFGIINYVHTEQDFVDWVFKTSFAYVTGYNDKLTQTPVANVDLTSNLLSYINEVKPYHVKVRDFVSKYGVNTDIAKVHASDYNKPAYYDKTLGKFRILDPNFTFDKIILKTGAWAEWYKEWVSNGPESKLIRKLNITAKYNENAEIHVTSSLLMTISVTAPGATPTDSVFETLFAGSGYSQVHPFDHTPQARTSIAAFKDGLRMDPDLIGYDPINKLVHMAAGGAGSLELLSFGYGATGVVRYVKSFTKTTSVNSFDLGGGYVFVSGNPNSARAMTESDVLVTLNGEFTNNFTVANGILTINDTTNGPVQVAILASDGTDMAKVHSKSFKGAALAGKTFAELLSQMNSDWASRWPFGHHYIVEVDGKRVTPEFIHNVEINSVNKILYMDRDPEPSSAPGTDYVSPSNLIAALDGIVRPIANGIYKQFTIPQTTRMVEIGFTSDPSKIVVTDVNGALGPAGAQIVVGKPGPNIDPYLLYDPNTLTNTAVTWSAITGTTWNTWTSSVFDGNTSDDPQAFSTVPPNTKLVIFQDRLFFMGTLTSDLVINVTEVDMIPSDMTGWVHADADFLKIGENLLWLGDENGLMTATDLTNPNANFAFADVVTTKFPGAQLVTITEFNSPEAMDTRTHVYVASGYTAFPISALVPFHRLADGSLDGSAYWVTLNGRKMKYGTDFVISNLEDAWDVIGYGEGNLDAGEMAKIGTVNGYGFENGYDAAIHTFDDIDSNGNSRFRTETITASIPVSSHQIEINPPSGSFVCDLGVFDSNGQPMIKVQSDPQAGEYSVSGQLHVSDGVYKFAASDSLKTVTISYKYAVPAYSVITQMRDYDHMPMLTDGNNRTQKFWDDFYWDIDTAAVKFLVPISSGDQVIITVFAAEEATETKIETITMIDNSVRTQNMNANNSTGDVYDSVSAIKVQSKLPL